MGFARGLVGCTKEYSLDVLLTSICQMRKYRMMKNICLCDEMLVSEKCKCLKTKMELEEKKSPTWSCVSYCDPQLQVGENAESFKQYHM